MPDVEPPTHGGRPSSLMPYQWILGVAESVRYWDCIVIVLPLSPLSLPLERESYISQMLGLERQGGNALYCCGSGHGISFSKCELCIK